MGAFWELKHWPAFTSESKSRDLHATSKSRSIDYVGGGDAGGASGPEGKGNMSESEAESDKDHSSGGDCDNDGSDSTESDEDESGAEQDEESG